MALIRVENVSFNYGQGANALSDVSLEINSGEFIAVVGHNGSGKSTLAKLLNGLLIPTDGKVYVRDMDTSDETLSLDIKKTVGIVFQNPDNQLVTTIVEDDVAFGPENLGIPSEEIRKRVDESLESVGMKDYALSAPHMLSGGQKQRIAIAGMLAIRPDVLVLDEATAMLDPAGRHEIISIANKLNKEQGITVVMITQYLDEIVDTDKVIVMCEGRIAMEGTPKQVFSQSKRLESVGLDVPPAVWLRNELIKAHALVPCNVLGVEEVAQCIYDEFEKRGITQ